MLFSFNFYCLLRIIKTININIIKEKKNKRLDKIVRKPRFVYQISLVLATENERERNTQPINIYTAIQRRLRRSGVHRAKPRLASFSNLEYSRTSSAARYG